MITITLNTWVDLPVAYRGVDPQTGTRWIFDHHEELWMPVEISAHRHDIRLSVAQRVRSMRRLIHVLMSEYEHLCDVAYRTLGDTSYVNTTRLAARFQRALEALDLDWDTAQRELHRHACVEAVESYAIDAYECAMFAEQFLLDDYPQASLAGLMLNSID